MKINYLHFSDVTENINYFQNLYINELLCINGSNIKSLLILFNTFKNCEIQSVFLDLCQIMNDEIIWGLHYA